MHNPYDELPYPSFSYSHTHPDHIAVLARLVGLSPAPVARARVLELGCASGGNLIPMAHTLPEARFVGIDVSARQIERGRAEAEALGLSNLDLRTMDIMDDTDALGTFDYIIAHGVYSWVPEPVRDKVLHICKHNLAPNGLVYVSYNTYPGWGVMGVIREMMLYRSRDAHDPHERAGKARQVLGFLKTSVSDKNPYGNFIKWYADFLEEELTKLGSKADAYLLHDELEEVNAPVFFYQFAEHAAQHGLQYVAEANFREMFPYDFSTEVQKTLHAMAGDLIEREQYTDLLRNKLFRQTLLCHDGLNVRRTLDPVSVRRFFVASSAGCESREPDIHTKSVEQFRAQDGIKISTDHPLTKSAMLCLFDRWPGGLPFKDLMAMARERLALPTEPGEDLEAWAQDTHVLSANLLQAFCYSTQLVGLHTFVPPVATELAERPIADPVARLQAQDGNFVTNLWHDRITLKPMDRFILLHLDGQNRRDDVVEAVVEQVAQGALTVSVEDQPVEDPAELREFLHKNLERRLRVLLQMALLVPEP